MIQLSLVALGWLKLFALGFLLAECISRIGAGALPVLARRGFSALSRFGLGFLLGLALLGPCLLGLACLGLFSPLPILAAALSPLAVSLPSLGYRSLAIRAAREVGFIGPGALLFLVGAAATRELLVPVTNNDCYIYHLAMPWNSLQAHRLLLVSVSNTFHLPVPVDITHVFPILLGDDRLARFTIIFTFLAASAVFADLCRRQGSRHASWLGPLLALSAAAPLGLLASAKNDVSAAAYFVTGALLWINRERALGALMLGFSVAAKIIYLPLAAIFVLLHLPSRMIGFLAIALASLPLLPWLIKNYLATGAPLFPFFTGIFETFDWGERNRQMLAQFVGNPGGGPRRGFGEVALDAARTNMLVLLLAVWASLQKRDTRKLIIACLLGGVVTLAITAIDRYCLPVLWLISFLVAVRIGELAPRARAWAIPVAAGLSLAQTFYALNPLSGNWRDMLLPRTAFLGKAFTTYEEAAGKLREIGTRRVITVGGMNSYRLPARVVHAGQIGETPLIWKLAGESGSVRRLAIRFRQVGAPYLLHNYVSAAWTGYRYFRFAWEREPLRIYVEYLKRYAEPVWRTETNDYDNGGFVLYRIRREPVAAPPERIRFAPGTEQLYAYARIAEMNGDTEAVLEHCRRAFEMLPDVGSSWNELGHAYNLLNDSRRAYEHLSEFAAEGMVDARNIVNLGIAALRLGRLTEAETLLKEAIARSSAQLGPAGKDLVRIMLIQAGRALKEKKIRQAMARIGEAEAYLKMLSSPPPWPRRVRPPPEIREFWAVAAVLRGQLSLAKGENGEAAAWFGKAWRIFPANPMVAQAYESIGAPSAEP